MSESVVEKRTELRVKTFMSNKIARITTSPRKPGVAPLGLIMALPLVLLPFGGWFVESGRLSLAKCSFKVMFGLPCMGCGATRATLNLLHGDLWEALSFSPMMTLLYVAFALWGVLSFLLYVRGRELHVEMTTWLSWSARASLLIIPFANWFYLMMREI